MRKGLTGAKGIKRHHNRAAPKGLAFGMLEPCALKGACTVLRGLGDGNIPWLLDPLNLDQNEFIKKQKNNNSH